MLRDTNIKLNFILDFFTFKYGKLKATIQRTMTNDQMTAKGQTLIVND